MPKDFDQLPLKFDAELLHPSSNQRQTKNSLTEPLPLLFSDAICCEV
jgi:hypothetical protein